LNKHLLVFLICLSLAFYSKGQTLVSMETSAGEVILKLYDDTPIHKANFLKLVNKGYYDSLLFHRVIKDFMMQGGDPNSRNASRYKKLGTGSPGYTLEAEIGPQHIHKRGALAAARNEDKINSKKKSNGSQFYIVTGRKYPRKYMPRFEETRGEKYSEKELIAYETIGGSPHLDGLYTVFGEVMRGLDIVEKVCNAPVNGASRPLKDVYILKIKVIR
jgi:cyclophilin family peptidyl-prolyl cis-trans isomerase